MPRLALTKSDCTVTSPPPEPADWPTPGAQAGEWERGGGGLDADWGGGRADGKRERLSDAAQCLQALSLSLCCSHFEFALYQASAPHMVETPTLKEPALDCLLTSFSPYSLVHSGGNRTGRLKRFRSQLLMIPSQEKGRLCPISHLHTDSKCTGRNVPSLTRKRGGKSVLVCDSDSHPTPHQNWMGTCGSASVWNGHDAFWLSINESLRAGENWRLHLNVNISLRGLRASNESIFDEGAFEHWKFYLPLCVQGVSSLF